MSPALLQAAASLGLRRWHRAKARVAQQVRAQVLQFRAEARRIADLQRPEHEVAGAPLGADKHASAGAEKRGVAANCRRHQRGRSLMNSSAPRKLCTHGAAPGSACSAQHVQFQPAQPAVGNHEEIPSPSGTWHRRWPARWHPSSARTGAAPACALPHRMRAATGAARTAPVPQTRASKCSASAFCRSSVGRLSAEKSWSSTAPRSLPSSRVWNSIRR